MPFSMAENGTIRHPWILCHSQWQRMLYVLNIAFSATIRRHDARTIDPLANAERVRGIVLGLSF